MHVTIYIINFDNYSYTFLCATLYFFLLAINFKVYIFIIIYYFIQKGFI